MFGCSKDCLILIPFRLLFHISCFSLKCFSSDSDNCPSVGTGPLFKFPHQLRAGPVLLTLLFFPLVPLSYRVLHGSVYFFHWSDTPDGSQLVFCMHFCIWRCIPDGSEKRNVLHIHLLLHHLLYSTSIPAFIFVLLSLLHFFFHLYFASLPHYLLA